MHWLKEYLAIPPIDQSEWLQFAKLGCIFVETFTIPEKVWIIKIGSYLFLRRKGPWVVQFLEILLAQPDLSFCDGNISLYYNSSRTVTSGPYLTLSQPGGQIMPTSMLRTHPPPPPNQNLRSFKKNSISLMSLPIQSNLFHTNDSINVWTKK